MSCACTITFVAAIHEHIFASSLLVATAPLFIHCSKYQFLCPATLTFWLQIYHCRTTTASKAVRVVRSLSRSGHRRSAAHEMVYQTVTFFRYRAFSDACRPSTLFSHHFERAVVSRWEVRTMPDTGSPKFSLSPTARLQYLSFMHEGWLFHLEINVELSKQPRMHYRAYTIH